MAGLYNPHIYFSFFHFPFIYLTHMHIIKISFPVLFFHSSYHTSLLLTCIFMKEINLSILFSIKCQYLYIKKKIIHDISFSTTFQHEFPIYIYKFNQYICRPPFWVILAAAYYIPSTRKLLNNTQLGTRRVNNKRIIEIDK